MKKLVRVMSVMLILVMAVACLASCGKKLSGDYKFDAYVGSTTYSFSGSKVEITYDVAGFKKTLEGEYKIGENDDGEEVITFTFADDAEDADKYKGEFLFNEGEEDGVKYIKIAGIKYVKQ